MKANELRIGNYVYDYFNESCKIDFVMICNVDKMKLKPIPITEEWLFKFGFAWRGLNEKFLTKYTPCGKAVVNSENGFFKLAGVTIEVEIKFVHQLQNLYFALTGEELTFKSE